MASIGSSSSRASLDLQSHQGQTVRLGRYYTAALKAH
jgi:hypothetical protein